MIAIYLRVSSSDQNPEGQRLEIESWLKAHNIPTETTRWFEDKETGRTLERPQFRKLMNAIQKGKFDTVVCWKLDRLSRNFIDGVRLIGDWTERGIRIVSVTQGIDFSGTTGRLIASVMFAVAEMELAHLKERQAAGIAAAKARGVYKGRKVGTTKADPARARALREQGLKVAEIAAALGVSARTVADYLK